MSQIWNREEPQSPCINICVIHTTANICTGCLRTMNEISGWSAMNPTERQAVLDELPDRVEYLKKRRGGRIARLNGLKEAP